MYDIEILIDTSFQKKKNYIGMATLWGSHIILKDVNSLFVASET